MSLQLAPARRRGASTAGRLAPPYVGRESCQKAAPWTSPTPTATRWLTMGCAVSHVAQPLHRRDIGSNALRPVRLRGPPDTSEIEPIAVGEREAVGSAAAAQAKLRRWHETAVGRKGAALGADNGVGTVCVRSGAKTPGQLDHLNAASVTPYDGAALTQRRVHIERGCDRACGDNRKMR